MGRIYRIACQRCRDAVSDSSGAALIVTLGVYLFLFILSASVYTIGESIHQRIQLQTACDAASYSAAVVQADALSRMAVVNRAMAWTYIQMTRRQVDYITYRWLRLTRDNFHKDYETAKDWHFCLLCPEEKHTDKGIGWWCGQGKRDMNTIRMNKRNIMNYDDIDKAVRDFGGKIDKGKGGGGASSGSKGLSDASSSGSSPSLTKEQQQVQDMYARYPNKSNEEIFTQIFIENTGRPEPPKFIEDPVTHQQRPNPDWPLWEKDRKTYVDKYMAKLKSQAEDMMNCTVCGKPLKDPITGAPADHSACFKKLAEQHEEESSAPSGGCSLCGTSEGGTHKHCDWGQGLGEMIRNDKETIESLNLTLNVINLNMMEGIRSTISQMLEYNLPRDAEGNIPDDFYFAFQSPTSFDPYEQHSGDSAASQMGNCFSPLYNTEEHEQIFLNMADGQAKNTLSEYFTGSKSEAYGIDQWLIRTYPAESRIASKVVVKPTYESFHAEGICRGYKNANRDEGASLLGFHRGNHIIAVEGETAGGNEIFGLGSILSAIMGGLSDMVDMSPSCINRRSAFPAQCKKVDDSIALVSEYRWASAKWFCYPQWVIVKIIWKHPFIPKFHCKEHGYGSWLAWIPKELKLLFGFEGNSRNDYRPCFMGVDQEFFVKGFARIYGDDRDLFNEQYVGTPARPWVLNERYFSGAGTIAVGLARRQRNPWIRLLTWGENAVNYHNGLFSLFDLPTEDNFMWTVSTARAAYRRKDDPENLYDVRFDTVADPGQLDLDYGPGAPSEWRDESMRIGCACGNGERLARAWNLCTSDWDATLLPVPYSRKLAKFDSMTEDGAVSWGEAEAEGQRLPDVFNSLNAGGTWMNFSGSTKSADEIMRPVNVHGAALGLEELIQNKVY